MVDALKRPFLRISPEFGTYAEEHGIFELFGAMLKELLIAQPENPLEFFIKLLSKPTIDVPQVVVYGPPASGQNAVSKLASRRLKAVHIQPRRVIEEDKTQLGTQARSLDEAEKELPPSMWAELMHTRLSQEDCVNKPYMVNAAKMYKECQWKAVGRASTITLELLYSGHPSNSFLIKGGVLISEGYVIEGFPRTREQALALQAKGITVKHLVHLEAPDKVLLERYAGKRIDSLTGDVYHLVFNPPKSADIADRLTEEPGGIEKNMHSKLSDYHHHADNVLSCYRAVAKKFNADQPIQDLFTQIHNFLCTLPRSAAPHTPRVLLLGPTGSGKSLQAAQLARQYRLVNIDCKELIKQTIASGSKLAVKMKPFHERGLLIPDDMVMQMLSRRLCQLDCAVRGYVLHGFPLNRDQAELMMANGHKPNRIFFLNIPEDSIKERLALKRVDPFTGERYHLLFKPPPSQEIKDRLQTHPRNSESKISERVAIYNGYVDELADCFSWAQHLNADQDPLTVFECIESMIVNPLPKRPQIAPTVSQT